MSAFYTIWLRDLTRFLRNRSRIFTSLAQPLLYLAIFGSGLSSLLSGTTALGGVSFTAFVYPGVIGLTIMFTALFTAISVVYDREFGFLKEVLVSPAPRLAVALGKVVGGSTIALLQGVLTLPLAWLLGLPLTFGQVAQLIGIMAVLAAVCTALGLLISTRLRGIEGYNVIINFLMMPLFLLSGALFPLAGLPGWMNVLVSVNPMAYATDALRQVALAGSVQPGFLAASRLHPAGVDVLVLLGFFVLFLVPAVRAFSKQE
ncbi:MAG TPA: ABC transporter permease [Anaerolineales bacterium]|nr:ABC transporter permease [Anaerolineales bacterium]HRQ91457.1 ABC transporter permease [Anaerolineales bacterium]